MSNSMSRAVAGYHMLMILSGVDGKVSEKEENLIKEFITENYGGLIDLDHEKSVIKALASIEYPVHFNNAMNSFYIHSTKSERNQFLDIATRLVASDKKVSPRENLFLNELFNAWEEEIVD